MADNENTNEMEDVEDPGNYEVTVSLAVPADGPLDAVAQLHNLVLREGLSLVYNADNKDTGVVYSIDLDQQTIETNPNWGYCLYCQTEHYPFCGYSCLPLFATPEQKEAHKPCEMCPDPEDVKKQAAWLGTPVGKKWLEEETS